MDKRKPRLHELIAVRSSLRTQAAKTMGDLANTFEKKQHHFTAKTREFAPLAEGAPSKVEEQLDLQTTVAKELKWLKPFVAKALDSSLHVAMGNTNAFADVVIEDSDEALLVGLPTSTLLELEDSVEELRKFVVGIPTLDPAKGFRADPDKGEGVFVARPVEKTRTQAKKTVYTLAPATDKHAAQVQLIDEQVPVGTIRETEWSSMLTVAQKGEILERVEKLLRAVKKGRARANETEVDVSKKIGETLLGYVFGA